MSTHFVQESIITTLKKTVATSTSKDANDTDTDIRYKTLRISYWTCIDVVCTIFVVCYFRIMPKFPSNYTFTSCDMNEIRTLRFICIVLQMWLLYINVNIFIRDNSSNNINYSTSHHKGDFDCLSSGDVTEKKWYKRHPLYNGCLMCNNQRL